LFRSQEAVKQTTDLIETSIGEVGRGSGVVQSAATTLDTIVASVEEVAALVSQISLLAAEQATAIHAITQDMDVISGVVADSMLTSQECANVAQEFSAQAKTLRELVNAYRLR